MFVPILNQMIFLFAFIVVGFIVSKFKFVPDNAATVLSKLENLIFVPALVMGTFIKNCTPETIVVYWKPLVLGLVLTLLLIVLSTISSRVVFKETYLRKIVTYGLAFSNFAYMGNAVMQGTFGDEVFAYYVVFTLPSWCLIYLWGVPALLMSDDGKKSFAQRMKTFFNPMFVAMIIGIVIGLTGISKYIPATIINENKSGVIDVAGACMSPIAMLLTGMTIGKIDLLSFVKKWRIYVLSAIKLLVFPMLLILLFVFIPQNAFIDETVLKCAICVACMPIGLNTIVIPAAYGKDTSDAAGMALITHALSVATIPLVFWLLQVILL